MQVIRPMTVKQWAWVQARVGGGNGCLVYWGKDLGFGYIFLLFFSLL